MDGEASNAASLLGSFSLYATCSDTMVTVEMLLIRSGRRTLVVSKYCAIYFSRWSTSYLAILEL
jgi:hypothetical protein